MKRLLSIFLLSPFFIQAQTIRINGTGLPVTINAVGKPSSVSISVPPIPEYFDPQSGDITFTDDDFQYSIPGYAKTGFTARSPGGFVEFRTSETSMDIKIAGDWVQGNTQSDCEVVVDGVWNQSVRVTSANTVQSIPI